tara:strand:+ start:358 stop:579 length:222 start_codon:yes stop_codon:yes gene_type:complete
MGRSLRNQIHLETKREQKKKQDVDKILDALKTNKNGNRSGMSTTKMGLAKKAKKKMKVQNRLMKEVRGIENLD